MPNPTQPSCTSPPPTTTGVPTVSPVWAAACAVTLPNNVPVSLTAVKIAEFNPTASNKSGCQFLVCSAEYAGCTGIGGFYPLFAAQHKC